VKTEESSLLMLSFPLSEDALLIGLACGEQMVEDACQLMGSRGNSHEANAAALRNLDKSGPTSASKV
jgi:hypothetical protein